MNIFAVNDDPRLAALELPDKLVPKMIVESAQMLSTAHRVLDGDAGADAKLLYKKAYENHPSTIWVRKDAMNYWWLWMHALTLCEEYKWRFTDETGIAAHKTETVIHALQELPLNIPAEKETNWEVLQDLPLCMPDQYKHKQGSGHKIYIWNLINNLLLKTNLTWRMCSKLILVQYKRKNTTKITTVIRLE
jgi:hypothetical protein